MHTSLRFPPAFAYAVTAFALLAAPVTALPAQHGGPLALLMPVSPRAASLGNAWVAGRDEYTIFTNPAQINATSGFGITLAGFGGDARAIATTAAATVGPYTFGWGVNLVDFSTPRSNTIYPYAPAVLTGSGDADLFSMAAVVAAQRTIKGFRVGLAGKYAQDIIAREASTSGLLVVPTRADVLLADIGTSRALWSGTAALAVQNIGQPYTAGGATFSVPTQLALGWTRLQQLGPLDVGYATQVTARREGWISPAGGVEVSWGWIEGYTVAGRVGARRTETDDEKPVGVGASFNADRLNLEYSVNFFAGNNAAHRLTVRWR